MASRWPPCEHGYPKRSMCYECMVDGGAEPPAQATVHGVYSLILAEMRKGAIEGAAVAIVRPRLTEADREAMVDVALSAYAAQARRTLDHEARADAVSRSRPVKSKEQMDKVWGEARAAGFNNLGEYKKFLSSAYLSRIVAMGDGRRLTRGEMTDADLVAKIGSLTKARDGITDTINEFKEHRTLLSALGVSTLADVLKDAA